MIRIMRRGVVGAALVAPLTAARAAGPDPVHGGTLTVLLNPEPPYLLSAIDPSLQIGAITTKIMQGLLLYDLEMQPQPLLAERWEVAENGLSWTFHLRRGVKWHDGRDFTSADVAYSLSVWKARGRQSYSLVTGVETPDAYTAIFRLSQPAPYLATKFSSYESPVIPRHVFEDTDISANPATTAPIGTGPFRFKEWARGNHVILERNPDYWEEGKPYLDRIVFRFIADASSSAAALEAGEAQLGALTPVPLSEMARLTATPNLMATTVDYDFDTTVNYNGALPDPSAGLQRIYWSKAAQRGVPSVAITGYNDPQMDHDFEEALFQNDPKKRWDNYADMQRRAMTDLPLIPLMEMRFITVASKRLINHTITTDGVIGGNFATAYFATASLQQESRSWH